MADRRLTRQRHGSPLFPFILMASSNSALDFPFPLLRSPTSVFQCHFSVDLKKLMAEDEDEEDDESFNGEDDDDDEFSGGSDEDDVSDPSGAAS